MTIEGDAELSPIAHFNAIYKALAGSGAYGDAIRACAGGLPTWLVPFSSLNVHDLERIARDLRVGHGDTIVDLACGAGGPSVWMAEHADASVTGVDFADAAVATARALAEERGLQNKARFLVGDIVATGLPDATFDGLFSIDAIMFVEPTAVASEMARLLKPGGRFVVRATESIVEPFLPTLVCDYRPTFEAAGLSIETCEDIPSHSDRELLLFRALADRADDLRAEMGVAAELLLNEAAGRLAKTNQPRRVRTRWLVGLKPITSARHVTVR